ncbi:hypothetical protein E2320_012702 [Naja naja]|nr:hypothetical protein E2320_012702 [Naja naja]
MTAKAVAVLLPILGSSWIFGVLAVNDRALGFFIFLFHCLLNSEVRAAFKHKTKVWSLTSSSIRNINVKAFNSDIIKLTLVVMDTRSFMSLEEASISPGENTCTEPSHLPR